MTPRFRPAKVIGATDKYGRKSWYARCASRQSWRLAPRCTLDEKHPTHNGAHMAKARHNREVHA